MTKLAVSVVSSAYAYWSVQETASLSVLPKFGGMHSVKQDVSVLLQTSSRDLS